MLAQALQDQAQEVRLLNRYAFALRRKRLLDDAERFALRALSIGEEDSLEKGYSYLVLGSILYDKRLWEKCLDYSYKAVACWESGGHERDLAWGYTNLGVTFWRLKSLTEAKQYLEKAISQFNIIGDIVHQASARMNLGIVLVELGLADDALRCLKKAEQVFRAVQDKMRMAMVANNMAHAYEALQQWENAVDAYRQSLERWMVLENTEKALDVIHSLIKLSIDFDQDTDAQNFLEQARPLLSSIEGSADYDRLIAEYNKLRRRVLS